MSRRFDNEREPVPGESVNRLVYDYARRQTFTLYHDAVGRGIINQHQAECLMAMWLERHPYEPLEQPTKEVPND